MCQFSEGCHFSHYIPGGYSAVTQMMVNLPPADPPPGAIPGPPPPATNGASAPAVKTWMCNKYNMAEGCKFGNQVPHGHGKPVAASLNEPWAMGPIPARFGSRVQMSQLLPLLQSVAGPTSSFGASAMAKISVDASLAGAIIGKGRVNLKQICCQTGAKLSIRDHESGPALRSRTRGHVWADKWSKCPCGGADCKCQHGVWLQERPWSTRRTGTSREQFQDEALWQFRQRVLCLRGQVQFCPWCSWVARAYYLSVSYL